jgi:heme exporter protein A
VGENLRFWAQVFRQGDIAPAVAHFDLAGLLDRRAGDLSAGQKRRLSLARLMVTGRKIWCLDEPTVSLDDTNTKRFAAMVSHHLLGGGVAIMATHINLGLPEMRVLNIADYAAKHQITDDPFAGVF